MRMNRLKMLADFLETEVPAESFDMDFWWEQTSCGSAGCALGWACAIPEFQEAGLKLDFSNGKFAYPRYESMSPISSAVGFFEISRRQAEELFEPSYYDMDDIRPQNVANRIRLLIQEYQHAS